MALSLQDLIVKNGLSPHQLDQEVSEEHLRDVSRIIADHEIVGAELGLTTADATAIVSDARTQELQKMEMLKKWKQRFAWKATYRQLIEALLKCGRGDNAQNVCELLVQSKHNIAWSYGYRWPVTCYDYFLSLQACLLNSLKLVLATLSPHTRPIVKSLAQMEQNTVC